MNSKVAEHASSSGDSRLSPRRSKWKTIGVVLVVCFVVLAFLLVGIMQDPPRSYMISNPQNTEAVENFCTVLEKRIDAHRKEIARLDWAAAAFDADRLWPLDMDLTVLSMQRFRLRHGRLPDSWAELRKSSVLSEQVNALRSIEPVADYWQRLENAGVISDNSCVHQNWELKRTDDAWEIIVPGWRKIGYGN